MSSSIWTRCEGRSRLRRLRGEAWRVVEDQYLFLTPFRYPPLTRGSRFRTRAEAGVWYGAREQRTAFAEAAYYRLLFLEGTAAAIGSLELDLSAFRAAFETPRGAAPTRGPF